MAISTVPATAVTRGAIPLTSARPMPSRPPLPGGTKVAVVSNAGGAAVLAADACVEDGSAVPELPADLIAELLATLPEGADTANPVDGTAAVGGH